MLPSIILLIHHNFDVKAVRLCGRTDDRSFFCLGATGASGSFVFIHRGTEQTAPNGQGADRSARNSTAHGSRSFLGSHAVTVAVANPH